MVEIKRLVISQRVRFTAKAEIEMTADDLTADDVREAVVAAPAIVKVLRSRNPKTRRREKLYVIWGLTYDGLAIYTKGKIDAPKGKEPLYVFVSSKRLSVE